MTTFEFRLHPIGPEVAFANVLYPLVAAHDVLRGHEQFVAADPAGDIGTIAGSDTSRRSTPSIRRSTAPRSLRSSGCSRAGRTTG